RLAHGLSTASRCRSVRSAYVHTGGKDVMAEFAGQGDLPVAGRPTRGAPCGGASLLGNRPTDPQKNILKPHLHQCGGIPPEPKADLVAPMEAGLALYQRPAEPRDPLVNLDEKPVQVIQETRTPWPAQPGQPLRSDYEDERVGTANVLLCTEP